MRPIGAALLSLSLLAACGSTVSTKQRNAAETRSNGLGGVEAGQSNAASGGAAGSGGAGPGAGGGSTGAARSNGGSGGSSVRAAAGGGVGPGVTADKIYVGLSYASSNAANSAIGAAGISQGDPKAEDQALIDDINSHGGVAGHKLEGVWHVYDGNSTAPWDVTDQQTCDDWTQDHKIFIAMAESLADSDTMLGCLNSRGVAMVTDNFSSSDAARFNRFPAYVELVMMNLDRAAAAEVAALQAQNWFSGWDTLAGAPSPTKAKVGIVTYEGAAWSHAVDQVMVPALRAAGYAPASGDIIRVSPEKATSDTGATGAATSSAVLKLRGDGVSHVIIFDRKGLLTLFFTRAADSQGYRPRYGFDTQNGVQALVDGAALPKQQLIGSKGIGWYPDIDLPAADSPQFANAQTNKCLALMKSKNIALADANAQALAMNTCSAWWLLRDAINASGGVLTRAGFVDGLARLGTSFLTAGNFANRFTATQHDGVGAYRFFGYDDGCGCMRYTGGNISVPS